MNAQLMAAGSLAVLGAAVHGVAGEVLVMRRLSPRVLSASPFGGPRTTRAMIHVSWHLTTAAFLTAGAALLVSGSALSGDAGRAVGLSAAASCTAFAAVVLGFGAAATRSPRLLVRHPGPLLLTATAVLAWWGAG